MKYIVLALLLSACSAPYEGERFKVAGIELEGMAWRVDCAKDTPHSISERWEYESPNWCDAKLSEQEIHAYEMCPEWWVIWNRYQWALREWNERCGS